MADNFHIRIDKGDGNGFVDLGDHVTLFSETTYKFALYNGDTQINANQSGFEVNSWLFGSHPAPLINSDHERDILVVHSFMPSNQQHPIRVSYSKNATGSGESNVFLYVDSVVEPPSSFSFVAVSYKAN